MMEYLKITFSNIMEAKQEELIALLGDKGFLGFEQKEEHLLAYAEARAVKSADYMPVLEGHTFSEEVIPEVNWNAKWERDFEPIILTDKVAIRADFHKPITSVKHEIIVTPKMSFGTGHHATTQLMLEQLSTIDFKGQKVFDYGTGTGVLAIYAEQLGAKEIIANDIDPWSQENAEENLKRNNCTHIAVRLGGIDVIPENGFDTILANINLNVLRASMQELLAKLKPDGSLLISGVLEDNRTDIFDIIELYSADYKVFNKDKWLCLHIVHS